MSCVSQYRVKFFPFRAIRLTTSAVSFGGVVKEVNLAYVPDVVPGDFVLVHVGFALSKVDPEEAQRVFEYLKEIDDLDELGEAS